MSTVNQTLPWLLLLASLACRHMLELQRFHASRGSNICTSQGRGALQLKCFATLSLWCACTHGEQRSALKSSRQHEASHMPSVTSGLLTKKTKKKGLHCFSTLSLCRACAQGRQWGALKWPKEKSIFGVPVTACHKMMARLWTSLGGAYNLKLWLFWMLSSG